MGGIESQINVVYGKIQISFFVGNAIAAKYTLEGEGLAREGWSLKFDVIQSICTDFSEALFLGNCQIKLTCESWFSAQS